MLDIGCGTGYNTRFLEKFSKNVTGLDYSESAVDFALKHFPEHKFIQGDANNIKDKFTVERFDLVTVLCVLYHSAIANDDNVIKQIHSILKPEGVIIITEPAFKILTRYHDHIDMGVRRYRISDIESMLKKNGFETLYSTYFGFPLFFPAMIMALYDRILPEKIRETKSSFTLETSNNSLINSVMSMVMGFERGIIELTGKAPLGVTLLIIAKKK